MNTMNLGMLSMGTGTVTVTATPSGGVTVPADGTGATPSIVSGLPNGMTATWSQPTVSSNVVTWTLTFTGSIAVTAGTSTVNLAVQVTDANTGLVYSSSAALSLSVTLTNPTLTFAPALKTVTVAEGASATDLLTFTSGGSFQGVVNLAVSGLPSGVTASFSDNPVTLASNSGTSTLTLTASPLAAVGSVTFSVIATGDGLTVTKSYTLKVTQAPGMVLSLNTTNLSMTSMGTAAVTVTATATGGLALPTDGSGASASIISGLPSGITSSWSQPTFSSGSVSWTLTLTGSPSAVASTGTLLLAGQLTDANSGLTYSGSQGLALAVTLTPPTLTFTPAQSSISVVQGASATDAFTLTGGGSYQGPVTLSVSGLPTGVSASWSIGTVNLSSNTGSSTLTLAATTAAPVGSFSFNVTATGDGLTVTNTYTVKVLQGPGMALSLNTANLSMASMGTATVTVTATATGSLTLPANGSGSSVAIVSGLPSGITASWSQPTLSSNSVSWTLTLTGSTSAVASSGTLLVSGQLTDANSGLTYSGTQGTALTVTLTPPTLALSPAQSSVSVVQGSSATDVFSLTGGGSYQGPVSLAVSGLPSGVTASWSGSTVNLSSNAGSSTLTLSATTAAPIGSFTFTVTASGDGLTVSQLCTGQILQAPGVNLGVSTPSLSMVATGTGTVTVTATPQGSVTIPAGASGASAAVVSGLPAGVTASWSQPVLSGNVVSWTLTLKGSSTAAAGSSTVSLSVQVTDANTGLTYSDTEPLALTLTQSAPTLTFSPALSTLTVVQGSSASDVFTFTGGGSYQGAVTLAISGLPTGVTASWSANPVNLTSNSGTSTLTFAATTAAKANTPFSFTVTATGDGLTVSQSYTGQVALASGVRMGLNTLNLSMMSMGTGTVTVTATPLGNVSVPSTGAGASAAVVSGLPTGFTATWGQPTVSQAGVVTWILTLQGSPNAVASNGTVNMSVQITDANSGISYTASLGLTLTVTLTAPTLTFAPALTTVPVVQGATATDAFTITGGGSYQGPVSLSVAGLPTGVTASWSKSTVNLVSNSGSSTLTLTAASSAAVNYFNFTVTATGDGLTVTKTYTVHVVQAPGMKMTLNTTSLSMTSMGTGSITVTATSFGGLNVASDGSGSSAAIVSGLPTGVTAAWSQPTVSSGVVTWTVTLTGSVNAVASSGPLVISSQLTDANTGIVYPASQSLTLTVTLTAPTLTFVPSVTTVPIVQGGTGADVFTFTGGGSYHGAITLAISGLPSGVTASWSSSPVNLVSNSGSSTLTLAVTAGAQVGSTTFTVTATGDGLTVTKSYLVKVLQAPGMNIGLNTLSLSMNSMGTSTITVTATPFGGLTVPSNAAGASAAVVSGVPTGFTTSWSQPTVLGSGAVSWTLTLQGGVNAVASSGTITVSAQLTDPNTGIVYSGSEGFTLNVALTAPTLTFSYASFYLPVKQGGTVTDVFTFTGGGSYHGPVSLAVSGLPTGITASWSNSPVNLVSNSGTSTLTLVVSTSTPVNWFTFTVTATGDGLTVSKTCTVQVGPLNGLKMIVSQPVLPIQTAGTASLIVTADPTNSVAVPSGAAGSSATIVSGLPSGVSASWSQPTVASDGTVNWTLSLSANSSVVAGSYPVNLSTQVTDASRGLVYTANQSFSLLVSLLANVSIGSAPGPVIPADFMGLSHEWDAFYMIDKSNAGVNPIYRQLLTNLSSYGSAPVNVRIGGVSTDTSGEPTATTTQALAEVAKTMGVKFELGVNLGADNVSLAVDQAKAYTSQMPAGSINALEIGNEPDFYDNNGLRPSTYTLQDYFNEYVTWQQNIMPVLPAGVKLAGPTWGESALLSNLPTFISDNAGDLALISQHYYATDAGLNPAPDFLLTPAAATTSPQGVAAGVATAHAAGIPFRMGEMGAADDSGIQGISDTFSAALWAVDIMFQYANVGVDGVNWQNSDGNFNSPFYTQVLGTPSNPTYTLTFIHPVYYGLLFFQEATGNGAQLLPVNLVTSSNLSAWAAVDSSGTTRLAIINKDETSTGTVAVNEAGYSKATVLRLQAPSYSSTSGVTLAGQTFDGSTDGTLQGSQTVQTITGTNGVFQLTMPVTSAALVVFSN
jgi:hypothetical protein